MVFSRSYSLTSAIAVVLAYSKLVLCTTAYGPGEVFSLKATANDAESSYRDKLVYVYDDGSVGLKESPKLFRGVLFQEYGLVIVPEPLGVLDIDSQNQVRISSSLYSPTEWTVNSDILGGVSAAVMCPNDDYRIMWTASGATCEGGIPVDLRLERVEVTEPSLKARQDTPSEEYGPGGRLPPPPPPGRPPAPGRPPSGRPPPGGPPPGGPPVPRPGNGGQPGNGGGPPGNGGGPPGNGGGPPGNGGNGRPPTEEESEGLLTSGVSIIEAFSFAKAQA